jgi:succinoglycan biosynthesis protein ExoM
MTETGPFISLCICTYRRPDRLDGLLDVVFNNLELPAAVEVVVVDNDRQPSSQPVVENYVSRRIPLRFCHVPEQNISLARNRAVAEARGEWIAMIDDDEQPDSKWLTSFVRCAAASDADAVFGPVIPRFPEDAPRWIIDGGYFERRRHPTGTAISRRDARTSNVFLRARVLKAIPGPFDPRFGLSGGEDSLLFRRFFAEGRRLVWCDDAIVVEYHSSDRLTAFWLAKRSFRTGQTTAHFFLTSPPPDQPSLPAKAWFFARTGILFIASACLFVVTVPLGRTRSVRWLRTMATQAGKACPMSVYTCKPYKVGPSV